MTGLATENALIRNTSDVEDFARGCFLGSTGDQVGVELEFLVFDRTAPDLQVPMARISDALPPLSGGSKVTFEPGGQLELSGTEGSLPDAIARLAADVDVTRRALWDAGMALVGVGLDPLRPARRQLHLPRYETMAAFLGAPYGSLMMCSTASIQVNLDLGRNPAARWERAHLLGPVLVAAFANSPLSEGRPHGWMSGRQMVWERLDPTRTTPVPVIEDPAAAWTDYLLDARLMLVGEEQKGHRGREIRETDEAREEEGKDGKRGRPIHGGSTLRDRLGASAHPLTMTDLAYHATTLFPPVRPRGWLEIRYLDAQHPAIWPVCVAVTHALVMDDRTADAAVAAAEPYAAMWSQAARCGLADPGLRKAADACFRAAIEALPRLGASADLVREVAAFADRHVTPGRSPAVDLLDLVRGPERRLPAWLTEEEPA
jgi:glutamate--cysteine ligase